MKLGLRQTIGGAVTALLLCFAGLGTAAAQTATPAKKPAPAQVNRIEHQTHDVPRRHQPNGFVFSKSSKTPSTPSTPTSDPSHPVDVN